MSVSLDAHNPSAAAPRSKARSGPGRYSRGRSRGQPLYSALDLGTNNCRLLIAKPSGDGFRVIDAFSRVVRLGEGVVETGRLSEDAIERTVEALKICAGKIARRRVSLSRHVATQACRVAANCSDFVERVYDETGLALDIISPAEEARLAVLGCQTLLRKRVADAIVFDIGGGSTEVIHVRQAETGEVTIGAWVSLPYGVVNLSEAYGTGAVGCAIYDDMVAQVKAALGTFREQCPPDLGKDQEHFQLLGTSGTVTTLASVQLGLERYDRNVVDGSWLDCGQTQRISRQLAELTIEERASWPCIGEERADLVVAGCAILDAILAHWPVDQLRVADRGIREGILRTLMTQMQR
ncbi:MAG: Ppx/GppA phosphatase family protein [Pseudomonadota bacterium]